jgi:uncharacterized membrane protein YfcA
MEWHLALIAFGVGLFAGFINIVAAGGSLITLPMLITVVGLPSATANGTNRVAILLQNIFALRGFKSKGINVFPFAWWLGGAALLGAIPGAFLAVNLPDQYFNRILSVVLILVLALLLFNPTKKYVANPELMFDKAKLPFTIPTFFVIGLYGGFIQAGVGFLIVSALLIINSFNLVYANAAKVSTVLIYTVVALGIFVWNGDVHWGYGLSLAAGNSLGGFFASRWSVELGDKWIRIIMITVVVVMATRLWFFT